MFSTNWSRHGIRISGEEDYYYLDMIERARNQTNDGTSCDMNSNYCSENITTFHVDNEDRYACIDEVLTIKSPIFMRNYVRIHKITSSFHFIKFHQSSQSSIFYLFFFIYTHIQQSLL